MPRLFVALRPPAPIRAVLADAMEGIAAARWRDDDQLHLTIRYIGEVDPRVAEDVAAAIGSIHALAPTVSIAGVGCFDRRGRTDAVWAGLTPTEALAHLHRKVDQACVRAGLDPERRAYAPHITLARFRPIATDDPSLQRWLSENATLTSVPFAATHLALFESRLGKAGAHYDPVARWPLGTTTA